MHRVVFARSTFVLIALGMTTAGCLGSNGRAGGGGWMPSVVAGEKATFGFHAKCENSLGKASLSYKDHGVDVSFKVAQLTLDETTHANTICDVVSLDEFTGGAAFVGNYTPQPISAGDGGLVLAVFIDNGLPGQSNDDQMLVAIEGGIYDGYSNVQFISHGQVNISPE